MVVEPSDPVLGDSDSMSSLCVEPDSSDVQVMAVEGLGFMFFC